MARIFTLPFALDPSGAIATVEDTSEQAAAQALEAIIRTRRGERVMAPDYGITDPVFVGLDAAEVQAALDDYGPAGIEITDVATTYAGDGTAQHLLTFDILDDDEGAPIDLPEDPFQ